MDTQPFAQSMTTILLWMLGIQFRSLLLIALAGMSLFLLRRSSAAVRHLALVIAFVTLLALPLLSLWLPAWSLPNLALPQSRNHAAGVSPNAPVETMPDKRPNAVSSAVSVPNSQASATGNAPLPVQQKETRGLLSEPVPPVWELSRVLSVTAILAFFVWTGGTLVLLVSLALSLIRLYQMASRSAPAATAAPLLFDQFSVLWSSFCLRQPVRPLIAPPGWLGLSPMTWGVRCPVVLLPAESLAWPQDRLRPVLLHELAHIQRNDWTTELLARMVCALYWPNPCVWILFRRLQNESEHACDDAVLRAGIAPAEYARQLIEILRGIKAQKEQTFAPIGAVQMAHHATAEGRVRAILAAGQSRKPATARTMAGALAVAAALLLPLASFHRASAGNRKSDAPVSTANLPRSTKRPAESKSVSSPNGIVAEMLPVRGNLSDGTPAYWQPNGSDVQPIVTRVETGQTKPDGSPLLMTTALALASPYAPPPYAPNERVLAVQVTYPTKVLEREAFVAFGVKKAFPKDAEAMPFWFGGLRTDSGLADGKSNFKQTVYSVRSRFPDAQNHVTMALKIASGPRKTIIAGTPTRETILRLPTGETARMSAAYRTPYKVKQTQQAGLGYVHLTVVKVTVPTRFVGFKSDYDLVPFGFDGRPFHPSHAGSDFPDLTKPEAVLRYDFRTNELLLSKVKEFRFMARPIQTVEFPNISLRPNPAPQQNPSDETPVRVNGVTFYNGALPMARKLVQNTSKLSPEEYRGLVDVRLAPGSDRFPNGLVAEGLSVSGLQTDGTIAAWDRNGTLLMRGPNGRNSGLNAAELQFQIERLKLPGMPAWIDKKTFKNLKDSRAIETEFGVVGVNKQPFVDFDFGSLSSAVDYGDGYFNFTESVSYAPRNAAVVDLYLMTSYGPWQELANRRLQVAQAAGENGDSAALSPLVTRRGGVEAEITASVAARFLSRDANGRPLWSLRLELVDAAGSSIEGPRVARYNEKPDGSPGARLRFRFLTSELPVGKVASVRLLARPAQTVYFRNVPTRPISRR